MHRFIFLLFFYQTAFAQQKWIPFSGKLTYSVQMADTALRKFYPSTEMSVITKETLPFKPITRMIKMTALPITRFKYSKRKKGLEN
jgi:hypothetical protein